EVAYAILAVLLIGMHDDFGIRVRRKPVAVPLQIGTKFVKIVDLAVQDHPNRVVLIADGLIPGSEVDDAEAPMAKTDSLIGADVAARGVRAAMHQGVGHAPENRLINGSGRRPTDHSAHVTATSGGRGEWFSPVTAPTVFVPRGQRAVDEAGSIKPGSELLALE